jgi:two-component system, chemotaxis family, protein-glutamate methylesterase/glutaminase
MSRIELVVIGASAGGLDGLLTIVRDLPPRLPATVIVVVHNNGRSNLPGILARAGTLPVVVPEDGDPLVHGRILVPPQDHHLLVSRRGVILNSGPRENGFRPAIDPLFRTAAQAYGTGVAGVILSGGLDDGTYGMQVIKAAGGITIVQDPNEASIPSMPMSAIANVEIDYIASAAKIGELLVTLCGQRAKGRATMAVSKRPEPQDQSGEMQVASMVHTFGPPSGITCPDCGGALWEIREGKLVRYRCHVGHQFTSDGLEAGQRDSVEGALWSAVRALEEQTDFRQRLAGRAASAGLTAVQDKFAEGARESHRQASAIRAVLFNRRDPELPEPAAAAAPPRSRARAKKRAARSAGRSRRAN